MVAKAHFVKNSFELNLLPLVEVEMMTDWNLKEVLCLIKIYWNFHCHSMKKSLEEGYWTPHPKYLNRLDLQAHQMIFVFVIALNSETYLPTNLLMIPNSSAKADN